MTIENMQLPRGRLHTMIEIGLWVPIALFLLTAIAFSWNPTPLAQILAAIFIASAFVHASVFYGLRSALILFVICVTITFGIENLGTATGFPFGRYHFEVEAGLPHIGAIPIIVGPLWFGAGYFSWVVGAILLDDADRELDQVFNFIALPIVAAFVMTQWDLVLDPSASTISKAWIWHRGGGDFGVPLSNYLGWLLTAWLFYQAFAVYLRRANVGRRQNERVTVKLEFIAILFYASAGLTHVIPWLLGQAGEVVDAAGHIWQVRDIREAAVVVLIFTMLFSATLAALRVAKKSRTPHRT